MNNILVPNQVRLVMVVNQAVGHGDKVSALGNINGTIVALNLLAKDHWRFRVRMKPNESSLIQYSNLRDIEAYPSEMVKWSNHRLVEVTTPIAS
jgi:hypothetical protein